MYSHLNVVCYHYEPNSTKIDYSTIGIIISMIICLYYCIILITFVFILTIIMLQRSRSSRSSSRHWAPVIRVAVITAVVMTAAVPRMGIHPGPAECRMKQYKVRRVLPHLFMIMYNIESMIPYIIISL